MNDDLLFELADRLQNRFFGKYRGTVTAVDAPTLRIKATVPAVLGATPTGWCLPCVPYAGPDVGFFFVPISRRGGMDRIRGRRRVTTHLDRMLLARRRTAVAGHAHHPRYRHRRAAPSCSSTTTPTRSPSADSNGGTVAFDSSGVTTTRGSKSVAVADDAVALNNDAFKVT